MDPWSKGVVATLVQGQWTRTRWCECCRKNVPGLQTLIKLLDEASQRLRFQVATAKSKDRTRVSREIAR